MGKEKLTKCEEVVLTEGKPNHGHQCRRWGRYAAPDGRMLCSQHMRVHAEAAGMLAQRWADAFHASRYSRPAPPIVFWRGEWHQAYPSPHRWGRSTRPLFALLQPSTQRVLRILGRMTFQWEGEDRRPDRESGITFTESDQQLQIAMEEWVRDGRPDAPEGFRIGK